MFVVTRVICKALWLREAALVWPPMRPHVAAAVIHVRTYLTIPPCCWGRRDLCSLQSTLAMCDRTGVATYATTHGRSSDPGTYLLNDSTVLLWLL